jgi:hypothetical protein
MKTDSTNPDLTQVTGQTALSVFVLLAASVALSAGHHWPSIAHALPVAAAIFPMASKAVRMGRVRALLRGREREQKRERERQAALEREALHEAQERAARLDEARRARLKLIEKQRSRTSRKSRTAQAREAEAERLGAEIPLAIEARRAIGEFRYHAETVRGRDEDEVFWRSDALLQGRELPPLNSDGDVPAVDATGRVLTLTNDRLVYVRRTRLFASLALLSVYRLQLLIKRDPLTAARLGVVREARALFWQTMRACRARDMARGL